jgi:DNA-binding LacI/PurR family transcriptional regulator
MAVRLRDIARECGVDVATVSRSLNGAYGVHEETRKKVLTAAARLNYRPNRLAKGLATGRSRTLALVISDIRNPFFAELARGAEDAAYDAGYELVLCNSDLSAEKQTRYIQSLLEKRTEGILMNSVSGLGRAEQEELTRSGIPMVLLNRPPASIRGFSTVLADNEGGGFMAGHYLVNLGHRVIGHLTGSRQHGNLSERAKGFQRALDGEKVNSLTLRGAHSSEGAYQMMRKLLMQHRDLTAVFAANDAMAFGAIRSIFDAGRRVPEDVSVIGFDNVEMAGMIRPPLTTIHQPKYEMGRAAVEILLHRTRQPENSTPEHRVFEVKLVERQSCRNLQRSAKQNGHGKD